MEGVRVMEDQTRITGGDPILVGVSRGGLETQCRLVSFLARLSEGGVQGAHRSLESPRVHGWTLSSVWRAPLVFAMLAGLTTVLVVSLHFLTAVS